MNIKLFQFYKMDSYAFRRWKLNNIVERALKRKTAPHQSIYHFILTTGLSHFR